MFEDIKTLHRCLNKHGIGVPNWPSREDKRAREFVQDILTSTKSGFANLDNAVAEALKVDLEELGFDVEIRYMDGVMKGCANLSVSLFSNKSNTVQFIKKG